MKKINQYILEESEYQSISYNLRELKGKINALEKLLTIKESKKSKDTRLFDAIDIVYDMHRIAQEIDDTLTDE